MQLDAATLHQSAALDTIFPPLQQFGPGHSGKRGAAILGPTLPKKGSPSQTTTNHLQKDTAPGIPRRSPIQVLTRPAVA